MNPIDYWYQKYIALKKEMDKLMSGSVEGKIRPFDEEIWVEKDSLKGFDDGDKVRIIILPNDEME